MQEYAICVKDVYKNFNVYLDKANTIKEKLLFLSRNRREKREVFSRFFLRKKISSFLAFKRGRNGIF